MNDVETFQSAALIHSKNENDRTQNYQAKDIIHAKELHY
jgi:hypothetical protein